VSRRSASAVAALLACALVSGCGADTAASTSSVPVETRPSTAVAVPLSGGGGDEIAVLGEIVSRVHPDGLREITIVHRPPSGAGTKFQAPGTRWLLFDYGDRTRAADQVDRLWRTAIISTAYRRLARERDLPLVRGWTAQEPGDEWPESGGISAWPFAHASPPVSDTSALLERLSRAHSEALRVVSVEVLQPDGAAPIVTLRTDDPWAFAHENSGELGTVLGDNLSVFEGSLVRVLGPAGDVIWIQGTASWAGTTVSWWAPELKIET
jgi:hypothetical protein